MKIFIIFQKYKNNNFLLYKILLRAKIIIIFIFLFYIIIRITKKEKLGFKTIKKTKNIIFLDEYETPIYNNIKLKLENNKCSQMG
jgi:hypothetical protein